MSQHYGRDASSQYWVALADGEVMGGVGIAPFNERSDVCEVRKLFLLPQVRGLGLGKKLLQQALTFARNAEFGFCYLDTLGNMQSAIALYEKFGFEHLSAPLEGTEHNGCDIWMMKKLS
jgi:putative acetyltransferase